MERFLVDLRYGARRLAQQPSYAAVAILTLALGIGANTAIFTVINAILLRPLSFPQSERIVQIGRTYDGRQVYPASEPKFVFWRNEARSFSAMAATMSLGAGVNLSGDGEPEFASGLGVSEDFFRVIAVHPQLGRAFTSEEDSPRGERVAILSHGLWQRRYAGDPAIIGRAITLNGVAHTVVAVMPADFEYTWPVDLFTPLRIDPASRDGGHRWTVIARLKDGVSETEARAEMQAVAERFRAAFPRMIGERESVHLINWQESLVGWIRPLLLLLLGAVTCLLLIACANVANLQLVQGSARGREMAIRLALGASPARLVRQLLTESAALGLAGGLIGLLLSIWGVEMLLALMPENLLPRISELRETSVDARVLGFALLTAVATSAVFGLAPALASTRVDVNASLKEGGARAGAGGAGRRRLRSALVVAEIALAVVLLIGAALLLRTFANLRGVDPGFDPRGVLSFQITPSGPGYGTTAQNSDLIRRALERLGSLPGVESAAVTSNLPLDMQFNLPYMLEGQTEIAGAVQYRLISPDYFRVMRMAIRQGRAFSESDRENAEPVIIVNESFASRSFKGEEPLGRRMCAGCVYGDPQMRAIVGVVGDTKQFSLNEQAPPTVFIPVAQATDQVTAMLGQFSGLSFVIRTTSDPQALSSGVRREMLAIDRSLPLRNLRALDELLARSVAPQRFNMWLIGLFAALGVLLAAVGIYGVISSTVAQRTPEIGLRLALGASGSDVLRMVIGQGMRLALAGIAIGLAGAFALRRLLESFLFGVSAHDPLSFALVTVALGVVAMAACYVPARRAMRVDPMVALRYE